jgi:hypothetical protein
MWPTTGQLAKPGLDSCCYQAIAIIENWPTSRVNQRYGDITLKIMHSFSSLAVNDIMARVSERGAMVAMGPERRVGLSAQAQPLVTPGKLRSTSRVTCRS